MGEPGGPSREEAYEEFRRKVVADQHAADDALARINPAEDFESREETETDIDRQVEEQLGPVGSREKAEIEATEREQLARIRLEIYGKPDLASDADTTEILPPGSADAPAVSPEGERSTPDVPAPPQEIAADVPPPSGDAMPYDLLVKTAQAETGVRFDLPAAFAHADREHASVIARLKGLIAEAQGVISARGGRTNNNESGYVVGVSLAIAKMERRRQEAKHQFADALRDKRTLDADEILRADISDTELDLNQLNTQARDLESILEGLKE